MSGGKMIVVAAEDVTAPNIRANATLVAMIERFMVCSFIANFAVNDANIVVFKMPSCRFKTSAQFLGMTRQQDLLNHVKTLMRVLLISERTGPEHQHIIKFNPLDFHTLGMVRAEPGVRASTVAESLGIAATTASSVIRRLLHRGWIVRQQCTGDRRAYQLTLTEEGQRLADAIHDQDINNMSVFLSALTVTEQDELIRLLNKVAIRVEALEHNG